MKNYTLALISFFLLLSCTNENTENVTDEEDSSILEDGKYCAEIDYFNPETESESTYQLFVDVENNLLIKIYWPNGGWLDQSHFEPPLIVDSETDFQSDKGYQYHVKIGLPDKVCEQCYLFEKEKRSLDSLEIALEMEGRRLELEFKRQELSYATAGDMVIRTGCRDMFIVELKKSFAVCKKIGTPFEIKVGDRLDNKISGLGITPVGNLTSHTGGNIEVIAITSTSFSALTEFESYCDDYMKTMFGR